MTHTVNNITEIICGADTGRNRIVNPEAEVTRLLTDSRSLIEPRGTLFFALKTDRADGHRYIPELYRLGVRHFVVSDSYGIPTGLDEADFIRTPDTAAALRTLAAAHRRAFDMPVIGITGSRGKTMVKEWLFALLCPDRQIARSPRSYNSQIGVPLSLWQLDSSSQMALVEAGISQTGEMASLCSMIAPDITVLTNIGDAHSEGFSSRQEKIAEKLKLAKESKALIYPAADQMPKLCLRP